MGEEGAVTVSVWVPPATTVTTTVTATVVLRRGAYSSCAVASGQDGRIADVLAITANDLQASVERGNRAVLRRLLAPGVWIVLL
jgi:hypothetical protein